MRKITPNFAAALIVLSAVALAPVACQAGPHDDKVKHAIVSAGLGFAAAHVTNDPAKRWALALAPGFAKEVYDSRPGGTGFDWKDMAANAAGAYIGMKVHGLVVTPRSIHYTWSF